MSKKTRFLQLSDTTMFEYAMLGEGNPTSIFTKLTKYTLLDNHCVLISPVSDECESYVDESGETRYKKKLNPKTLNTINNAAFPMDSKCSKWYHFKDPDYMYMDSSTIAPAIKVSEFEKYEKEGTSAITKNSISGLRADSARLYFVNGYDFGNIYGMLVRISVDGKETVNGESVDKRIDLCDFFFSRDNAYKFINYLPTPIIFGNDIYDRYIEINLPCLYDIINTPSILSRTLSLHVNVDTTIKLSFATILDEDVELSPLEYTVEELATYPSATTDKVNLTFVRSVALNGTVPTTTVNSDRLGCYLAEVPDYPYIMFYATWRDEPLTKDIVWQFNKGIRLYDTSLIRNTGEYEVDADYEAEHSERKWMAVHEIKCTFCNYGAVVRTETYSMDQIFISDNDPVKFYYRPVIFDEQIGKYVNNIQIVYTMKFMNVNDKIQFVKTASLSLVGNMGRFYAKSTNLSYGTLAPFKVYNRIEESKQESPKGNTCVQKTKFVKVFYNSTDVVLDDNGTTYGTYGYTLQMSIAPKSYKFVFKKMNTDGGYSFMDLTDGYYKLMFRDSLGNTVLIEPTYTKNMNMYLGELEFNISSGSIAKLQEIEDADRKMSIVAYNEDGSVSSMLDFLYTI